ncbi:Os03g0584224, partial [Oryza sativa Japonica Group]
NLRQRTRRRPAAYVSWAIAVPVPSSSRRQKRAAFLVFLTPEEIEEDIYAPPSPSLPSAPPSFSPSCHRSPLSRPRRCPPSHRVLTSSMAARRVERRLMEKEMEARLWSSRCSGRRREKKEKKGEKKRRRRKRKRRKKGEK